MIKLVPMGETVLMSGPTAACDTALPQAALGQRPSDAYKNNKKKKRLKRVDEVRIRIYGPRRSNNTAIPRMSHGSLKFSSYSSRSSTSFIRPRMRSLNHFFRVSKIRTANKRRRLTSLRVINRFHNASTHR